MNIFILYLRGCSVLANHTTRMYGADWATRPFTKVSNCYKIQP